MIFKKFLLNFLELTMILTLLIFGPLVLQSGQFTLLVTFLRESESRTMKMFFFEYGYDKSIFSPKYLKPLFPSGQVIISTNYKSH